ncbi:fungal-specific transcription factor domain-containing protein [Linnemannia elongata]|nr:fungal-specific transcription factor domain-containing protein [Linnemannia elongata]
MADNKRLRVSKACDSCRRKKVKCDAIHPLCTNCETFNYECTYNDPTKKRGPPKGKLVPMMTGYIEAIEARLHRMEGLLGGLVKDKDPRAEIVRAELDAMAREAEMTGLKLRRSKAYEEIHNAMSASSASSTSASASSNGTAVKPGAGSGSGSGMGSSSSSAPGMSAISRQQPTPLQQQQQQQYQSSSQHPHQHPQPRQQLQQTRIEQEEQRHHSSALANQHSSSNGHSSNSQHGSGYRPHVHTPAHSDPSSPSQSSTSNRTQPMLQPSPVSAAPRSNQYHPYDTSRHGQPPQSHHRPPHTLQHNQSPSSHSSAGSNYPKQHPTHHHHQQQQQQQSSPQQHSQYNSPSSYSSASFQNSNHHSNYSGSPTHPRGGSSSSYRQNHSAAHERGHSAHEGGHHRTGSSHSSGSSSVNFGSNHQAQPPSSHRNGHYGMETHRIVTHRPSLTAHQLSNPLTGYMPVLENPIKEESLIMPSVDVIDHLLDIHFRSVHPVLPFLHFQTISDQVHHNESPPPHLLFAVLGLASRFSDNPTFRVPQAGLERPPCTIFYERAKHFIKDEYDNSQIATVQAFLLMAVQQMGFCESQRAWLYVGMAVRMAQGMGLNKEPSEQEQSRNRLQCELRKRTWWSIYVIERFICAGLGRPLTITHKDCEAGFPQYEDDEGETPTNRPVSTRTGQIANFVRLITLSKIQGNILEYIRAKFSPPPPPSNNLACISQSPNIGSEQDRDFQVDTTAAAFSALDKALTTWRQGLPESLQNPTAQSPHIGLFLHLNYNTLVILLHRPEISTSPTSASLCTQAAATITDIIEILMDAKALTSVFISCIYSIFSAGIVHFMNIPSVKKGAASAVNSPVLSEGARKTQESHTKSAKTNLKRCIDALKFLATHWVSAASRAKVLEDLLDLKHVSLKDLEVDTFKTSPVGPSWALDSSRYKEALVAPRETQDKLRQQCRSKAMTIHSMLANDEDFLKMQQRRSSSSEDHNDGDDNEHSTNNDEEEDGEDVKMKQEDTQDDTFMERTKSSASLSPVYNRPPIGLGVQSSPHSSAVSVSSPVSARTDTSASLPPMESDPVMVLSTAKLGLSDSPAINKPESILLSTTGLVRHENGVLTPMTMTTLAQSGLTSPIPGGVHTSINGGSRSEGHSPLPNGKPLVNNTPPAGGNKQGAMLDPFSMPSSISFPDWNNNVRRPSHGGNATNSNNTTTTVWTTDSLTHRTTAHSATSSPMISSTSVLPSTAEGVASRKTPNSTPLTVSSAFQPSSSSPLYSDATPGTAATATGEDEEHDLVWNDMPLTLGLDEWTAYIGAMMMRWLYASGHSSPQSAS